MTHDPIRALIDAGRTDEATAMVEAAARSGDVDALYRLADWRLFGLYGPQDFLAAHAALDQAAARGSVRAAKARAYLIAAGIGCPADFPGAVAQLRSLAGRDADAAGQIGILASAPTIDHAMSTSRHVLSERPLVVHIPGFASEAECAHLAALGEPALRPAMVVDPATGDGKPDPVRRSDAMSILALDEDLVVHHLNRRIAAATGTTPRQGEPLNILRYVPGQEFRRHHDAYGGVPAASQRILTVLLWLNDTYSGGETVFTEIGLSVRGRRGDALIFRNTGDDGRRDERGWHAGMPVTAGVKWLASRWIRAGDYPIE